MIKITTHSVVKNEERWVWFALKSVMDYASTMLVADDSSTDRTGEVIRMIKSPKIKLRRVDLRTAGEHTKLRNEMVKETKTDWFILLDGDEIWNRETVSKFVDFLERQGPEIYAVVMRTRNLVGDVYHYLPEAAGNYRFLGRKGHLTIRAYRKLPGWHWAGTYPLEVYVDESGVPINEQDGHLAFFEGFYWHTTHLRRSSVKDRVKGWRKMKVETGSRMAASEKFPEVFYIDRPKEIPSPWTKRSVGFEVMAKMLTPLKEIKRSL